jgi:HSP20 family protein
MEATPAYRGWPPLENLRRDFNQLFQDFGDRWGSPLRYTLFGPGSRELTWAATPAVDIAEKDKAYEITAELPGRGPRLGHMNSGNLGTERFG